MSVRPVSFNADGSIEVYSDETGHRGTIAASDIAWARTPNGDDDHNFIVLGCPDGCGQAGSMHPVGGGAAPAEVQEMFVRKHMAQGTNRTAAIASVRKAVEATDGPDRWRLG